MALSAVPVTPAPLLNRELSLLAFQERVLEEVRDSTNPLLERVKFLAILGSNLDEFFMVRVAGLKQQLAAGLRERSFDGRTVSEQLAAIRAAVTALTDRAYQSWNQELVAELRAAGIRLDRYSSLKAAERKQINQYFLDTVFPVLTPLGFDPGRPFPFISNLSLNLAVAIRNGNNQPHFARVKVPDTLPQLIPVDATGMRLVWLEEVIAANLSALFPGLEIIEAYPFRLTRDAEVEIQELESDDLLETIEEAVWRRRFRSVVRLQVDKRMPEHMLKILSENLEVTPADIYPVETPLALKRLMQLQALDLPHLKFKSFVPHTPPGVRAGFAEDLFGTIRKRDILLHHPFESFQPVIDFLRTAARDPDVLAIKTTLYRVGRNSPIVAALLNAIEEGKQVSAVVELKARFDEESNIEWARALESQGVHVVYGLVGLKVHGKMSLVVRREGNKMRKYVHLGTGNYNSGTARLYTDFSLFTADDDIGADAVELFNLLTGYSRKSKFRRLLIAPVELRRQMASFIEREIAHAKAGRKARIIGKMNALDDPEMIELFYRASTAGVTVDLIVRGICSLRPGVKGLSENIRVVSIVGRFLEHSRLYYFENGGEEEIYFGSADLMPRNLNRRVEVIAPICGARLKKRLKEEVLDLYLSDNRKARRLTADGTYERVPVARGARAVDAQARLLAL